MKLTPGGRRFFVSAEKTCSCEAQLEAKGLIHTSSGQRPGKMVEGRSQAEGLLHRSQIRHDYEADFQPADSSGTQIQGVALG